MNGSRSLENSDLMCAINPFRRHHDERKHIDPIVHDNANFAGAKTIIGRNKNDMVKNNIELPMIMKKLLLGLWMEIPHVSLDSGQPTAFCVGS